MKESVKSFAALGQLLNKPLEKKSDPVITEKLAGPAVEADHTITRRRFLEVEVKDNLSGQTRTVISKRVVRDRRVIQRTDIPDHAKGNVSWPEMPPASKGRLFPDMIKKAAVEPHTKASSAGSYNSERDFERRDEIRLPSHLFKWFEGENGTKKIVNRNTGKMTTVTPETEGIIVNALYNLFNKE